MALAGIFIQPGDVGRHEIAAADDRPAYPALVVGQRDAVDDDVLERDLLFGFVGNDRAIFDIQVAGIFTPRGSHQLQDLLARIRGGGAHGIAHAPGQAAGNRLPFVGAVFGVDRA